jgi:hypothetical protein
MTTRASAMEPIEIACTCAADMNIQAGALSASRCSPTRLAISTSIPVADRGSAYGFEAWKRPRHRA